jgi:hypothetical protein
MGIHKWGYCSNMCNLIRWISLRERIIRMPTVNYPSALVHRRSLHSSDSSDSSAKLGVIFLKLDNTQSVGVMAPSLNA